MATAGDQYITRTSCSSTTPKDNKAFHHCVKEGQKYTKKVEPEIIKRKTAISDKTLENGYNVRLDRSLGHWSISPEVISAPQCQLHNWATASMVRKIARKVKCEVCDVHFCIDCFIDFNTIQDIIEQKDNIKKRYIEALNDTRKIH